MLTHLFTIAHEIGICRSRGRHSRSLIVLMRVPRLSRRATLTVAVAFFGLLGALPTSAQVARRGPTTGVPGNVIKTMTDLNGGSVLPGDTLVVDVEISNFAGPLAIQMSFVDVLPSTVTYVPNTLAVTQGANAGPKTDDLSDDQGFYEGAFTRVRFRLGAGATATQGGTLAIDSTTAVRFRVVVNSNVTNGTVISNQAIVRYTDPTAGSDVTVLSLPPGGPVAGAPTTLTVETPDLTITKSHTGNLVRGSSGAYSLTVSNAGPGISAGTITVLDTLPVGLTPATATGSGWTCGITGQVVACTRSGAISDGASAPAISLTVLVAANAPNNVTNTGRVGGGSETNTSNNIASDPTTIVDPPVDVSIAKTHTGNFATGQNGSWSLAITNSNVVSVSGPFTVTDTLAAGLSFVAGTGAGWSCSVAGQVVTCTNPGPLAGSATSTISLTVAVGAAAFPNVTNRAWVAAPGDVVAGNNVATDAVTVESIPDLTVVKTAVGAFAAGSNGTFSLVVSNLSAGPTTGAITVTDPLPAGLTFVSGTGSGWSCGVSGQNVTCTNPGPMAGTSTITLTVAISATAAPSVANTATVSTAGDVNSGNNSSTAVVPVAAPDLTIAKSTSGGFTSGSNGLYTLTVSNVGTAATTNAITVVDTLPNGLTFVSGTGGGWSCGAIGQVVTCSNAGPIGAASSSAIALLVGVGPAAAPSVTNRAHVATPNETDASNNSASVTTAVTIPGSPNLAITKSHVGNFVAGQSASWAIGVTNVGTAATTGLMTVVDTLPAGIGFVSGSGSGWSCGVAGQVVTCTNAGPLAAAGSLSLTLNVSVGAAAYPGVTNRAHVSTPGDGDASNNTASDATTVVSIPDLTIVKAAGGAFVVGNTATYSLTVSNVAAGPTTGAITVADVLPVGLTYVSGTGSGWSCAASGQAVTCTNPGPLGAGASSGITLTVAVGVAAAPSVQNTATVTTQGDVNGGNNSSTVTTPVPAPVLDLTITKSAAGAFVAGRNASYQLAIANTSQVPTTGVTTITDVLPTGLTFVSGAGSGFSCSASGQSVTCTYSPVLGSGQSAVVTLTVAIAPNVTGTINNTATVSTPGDGNGGNNSSTVGTPVGSGVDLAITKASSTLMVGSNGTFTIGLTNVGSQPTTGAITVTDLLPNGLTFVSGAGAGFSCTAAGQTVTCTRTTPLAPTESATITLTVAVGDAASPSIVNTATVSTPGDNTAGNNTATTGTVPVGASTPDLSLTKSVVGPLVAGANATFRLTVANVGTGSTTGAIVVTDVLQNGLTFVRGTGSNWTCGANGQTVTCSHPGPLAPTQSTTVDLVVAIAPSVTSVSNTATVTTPGDANGGNNTGSIGNTPTILPPDLTLTKTASGSFVVGQMASYTLVVRNAGQGPTTGPITVTDIVPTGLTVTAATGNGWTCTIAGQMVTCTNPVPLAPNATSTITISVLPTAAAGAVVTNTATVNTPGDGNGGNNDGTTTTPIGGAVDLALTKQGPDSAAVGSTVTWTLTVRNVGTAVTTGTIVVTDTLPAGLAFASGVGVGFTCAAAGQIVTCTREAPPLAPNQLATIDISTLVVETVSAAIRNVACVRAAGDGNSTNDCGVKNGTLTGAVDLVANKETSGPFTVGAPAVYTLTVRNAGNITAITPIFVTDTLPNGLTFASASGAGWNCSAVGQVVTCMRSTPIPAATTVGITLTVNVLTAAAPRVTNCMSVRGSNETVTLANNRSCADAVVTGRGRLEIEKQVTRTDVQIGDAVDYAIIVRNTGLSAVIDAFVTDVLPAGFLLEVKSVRFDGVVPTPSAITGAPGPSVSFDIGRVNVGQRVTITYRARVGPGARNGPNVNVATAASRSGGGATAPARAAVRVTGGVFQERGAIVGKVYVSCNCARIGQQEAGDVGIPGVRVYLEDGTSAVTDVEGKYSFYNVSSRLHVVKVDRHSLPNGAELVPLTNRNARDGYSRFADVKAGELHRADFAEGSRSAKVLGDVLARRRVGEVNNAGDPATPITGWTRPPQGATPPAADRVTLGDTVVAVLEPARARLDTTTPPKATRYAPLFAGQELNDNSSQLPVTPLRAGALQRGEHPSAGGRLELTIEGPEPNQAFPADGQTRVPVFVRALDAHGNRVQARVPVTLETSLGRLLGGDLGAVEQGVQATLDNGEGRFVLIAAAQPGVGEVRVTSAEATATTRVAFVPANRPLLATGLVNARIDFMTLVRGGLGIGAADDGFEESLRDWSFDDDSGATRGGARAALLLKGNVLDNRLLTLSYDSERDRGRTFFRDIHPDEFFPVYGDASMREFDAQSRRRFYARLDKGTNYSMYGDFSTTRADDRRILSAYDRSLTGAVQHIEGSRGALTAFASRGRVSQAVEELIGLGISGPYALTRAGGLVNSERVEIIVRDRNQPTMILSRTPMTRFADYTLEPGTGRLLFRAPVPSADANLNPISIRVTYETENGTSEAFWVYGLDGSVRAGDRLELGATFAKDESPTLNHQLVGVNATGKLGKQTTLFGEYAQTEGANRRSGSATRVELRHQSSTFDARAFVINSDRDFSNRSVVFSGGRKEWGGRFTKQLAEGTRLIGEVLRSESGGAEDRGALFSLERQFTRVLRGEFGYRYANNEGAVLPLGGTRLVDRDVSALRAKLQWNLPAETRTSLFGEVEQDVRSSDQRRVALGGEYLISNRARLYGRHEFLNGLEGPYAATGQDKQYTVVGIDADYLKNTQMFSEYRARDAFAGRDAQASIGLRNRWAVAPNVLIHTSFERVSPLFVTDVAQQQKNDALAITGALEWTQPSLSKTTARLEFRNAESGDNALASFGYARKLSRDWTLLGRTVWDDFKAGQHNTRGFSQLGFAWRQTDRNKWNGLARYEQRVERTEPALTSSGPSARSVAHILASMLNYQPAPRLTLSGRYAARSTSDRGGGVQTSSTAQLLMGRGILDLTQRVDAGIIASSLFSDGFSDRSYGLGGEVGVVVLKNMRLAGGYNLFGFTDKDLNSFGTTRKGPYLELGFKFDESLFGLGSNSTTASKGGPR